jgi:hypothetical protein
MRTHTLLATLVLASLPSAAAAEPTEVVYERIDPNPDYGVGIVVGTTVGATAKIYFNPEHALVLSAGSYHFQEGLSVEAGWVWQPAHLIQSRSLTMPVYIGAGGRLSHWDHDDHMHSDLAARAPIGVAAEFGFAPLDLFMEAALDVNLVSGNTQPHRRAAITAAIGSRYFF